MAVVGRRFAEQFAQRLPAFFHILHAVAIQLEGKYVTQVMGVPRVLCDGGSEDPLGFGQLGRRFGGNIL